MKLARRPFLAAAATLALPVTTGCDDSAQRSEAAAAEGLEVVLPVVERDAAQVRNGVPEGAKELGKRLPDDPAGSRQELQEAIKAARSNVSDLTVAKVTFFGFASPEGVVLRNETDPDRLVDQNIVKAFPDLAKALEGGKLVETYGEMEQLRGVKRGADVAWVVAHPVPAGDGTPKGLLVTGWSTRLYARVLEQHLRGKLTEKAKEKNETAVPLSYVFIVKGSAAYGDPEAPDVTADELAKLDLVGKTVSGPVKMQKEIEKRVFGIAAKRAPSLGDDVAVAVVASVF